MLNCKPISTPVDIGVKLSLASDEKEVNPTLFKQIVGSLRYLCHTRPDIAYGVGLISRYMVKPTTSHLIAAKRILRYVKGTSNYGIQYSKNQSDELVVYSDSDWSGDKDDRKSIAAYVFMIGNAAFSWSSEKESVVALSSCEAEYIAAFMTACQAQWINMLLMELQLMKDEKMELRIDSKLAIDLAKHPVAHGRNKHIETKFHFLRDQVNKGKLEVRHCKTDEQITDLLTKPLKSSSFDYLKMKLGMAEASN